MKLINNSLQTSIDTLWKQELSAFQDRGYILSNPERFQNESHSLRSLAMTLILIRYKPLY